MTEKVYLEETTKFWEGTLDGKGYKARYGKLGANGQTTVKDFDSVEAAKKAFDKIVAEKLKKGYSKAGGGSSGKEVAKGGSKAKAAPKATAKAKAVPKGKAKGKKAASEDEEDEEEEEEEGEDEEDDEEEEEEEEEKPSKKRKAPAKAPPAKKAKSEPAKSKSKKSNVLDGKVICQSGTMSISRKEMDKLIADNGGEIASSLTKKVTHLLLGSIPSQATAKMQKAEEQGVEIIDEETLRNMIDGDE